MARPHNIVPGPGRAPPDLSDAVIEAIAADCKRGLTFRLIAPRLGVDRETFRLWLKRGEAEAGTGTQYAKLYQRVGEARGELAADMISNILRFAPDTERRDLRTLLELLSRMFPHDYGQLSAQHHVEVTVHDQRPIHTKLATLVDRIAERIGPSSVHQQPLGGGGGAPLLVAGDGETGAAQPVVAVERTGGEG
jgi:hypothetical protein